MTMTPTEFQELFDKVAGPEPATRSWDSDLAVARRALRRRRSLLGISGVVAMTLAVGAGATLSRVLERDEAPYASGASTFPDSATTLLSACESGNQSAATTGAVFGPGRPIIAVTADTAYQQMAILESSDGSYAGVCWIHHGSQEFHAGLTAWSLDARLEPGRLTGAFSGYGVACPLVDGETKPGCNTTAVWWADRLPARVASVRFQFMDGSSKVVDSVGGYALLNAVIEGPIPETDSHVEPIASVTYRDAAGTPLASSDPASALPDLNAFPSLHGDEIG